MRTSQIAIKYKKTQNVPKEVNDDDIDKYLVTSTLYCTCRECKKYRAHKKPLTSIDPFLIDMRYTYWIYSGLVTASKTERAPDTNAASSKQGNPEKDPKGKMKDTKDTIKDHKKKAKRDKHRTSKLKLRVK